MYVCIQLLLCSTKLGDLLALLFVSCVIESVMRAHLISDIRHASFCAEIEMIVLHGAQLK